MACMENHISAELFIEHVGSTAVPNLGGKDIIDMAIATKKAAFAIDVISQGLKSLGYIFRENRSSPERFFFRADLPDVEQGVRRYHIHLTFLESHEWEGLIAFRDYVRKNPEEAKKYAKLKKETAEQANQNGSMYRRLKAFFFQEALKKMGCKIPLFIDESN